MKSIIAKKIVVVIMMITCIAGMALSANAATVPLGAYTSPSYGSSSTYSSSYKQFKTYLNNVGFNGLPSGTWAYGADINIGFYHGNILCSGGMTSHTTLHTTSSKVSFRPVSGTDYSRGGYTNCSRACTASVTYTFYT
ncbi:hypothetical protein SAMN02910456_01970 [Ruminococcaceae bacterium YRB3002]|nr:hypothetical protein SAMN02910456_01970 [Ruminococcaceae bacterium YRB3002]